MRPRAALRRRHRHADAAGQTRAHNGSIACARPSSRGSELSPFPAVDPRMMMSINWASTQPHLWPALGHRAAVPDRPALRGSLAQGNPRSRRRSARALQGFPPGLADSAGRGCGAARGALARPPAGLRRYQGGGEGGGRRRKARIAARERGSSGKVWPRSCTSASAPPPMSCRREAVSGAEQRRGGASRRGGHERARAAGRELGRHTCGQRPSGSAPPLPEGSPGPAGCKRGGCAARIVRLGPPARRPPKSRAARQTAVATQHLVSKA